MKRIPLLALMLSATMAAAADLEKDFANPPDATKPRCYWYWMDGHITKEGITKDLEAMRQVGIGEGYIGVISGQTKLPADETAAVALSDEWWGFIEHAVREGGRLGVDIGLFNSPGWSQSGGPWVTPDKAMRYVTLPETRLKGPQHFEGKLPAPVGDFQDVAVLAFPVPAGDGVLAKETARTSRSVIFEMSAPFTARSVLVHPTKKVNVAAELQVSDDGMQYRTVKTFTIDRHNLEINVGPVPLAPIVASFPAVTARFFKLNFSEDCELGEIQLSPAMRVESFAEKSMIKMFQDPQPPFDFYTWPAQVEPDVPGLAVDPAKVLDLTASMASDGTLKWDVPEGEWIVLRSAMTPTGTKNSPSPPEATGLEVDKMNRDALKVHFDAYVGNLLNRIPAAERTAWKHVVADSYEMGPQNWTDGFAEDFAKRFGYDPMPWLPVLTGRVVGSAEQSDRFLWDLRRMVSDRVALDYVGGLRDLCNQHGLKMWLENYGHWGFPSEFLLYGGYCDEISGEFWVNGDLGSVELRDAASAAHIYGMPIVWAEAFTGGITFANAPRELKARGDWAFCEGINQFVLHVYIHQPWDDRRPGINAWFGTEFNRHNTWFAYSKPWIDYLRRCSVMLQAGMHVADVAYFIGEDAPKMTGIRKPELPAGYDFDYINADVIENRLSVKDGRFVLPDGMSFRLLVLPESKVMRPELLKKLQELAAAGGVVLGPKPERSPSLKNYPACDAEVQQIATALWNGGGVLNETDLDMVLGRLQVPADVLCPKDILWKHRQDGDRDIYFVSNQREEARDEKVSFRVSDRAPELWWPDTGKIEAIPSVVRGGYTIMTLHFDPAASVFVVFSKTGATGKVQKPQLKQVAEVNGPWQVRFPSQEVTFDKLTSWTKHADPAIKYFSGAAVYSTKFTLPTVTGTTVLNLGTVDSLAKVRVNGQDAGTVWKFPYSLDISAAVKSGNNSLEVEIVNNWLNRLVGDAQPGVTEPETFVATKTWKADTPLQSSGLLGPVTIMAGK
ncbi:MAG: glycoside hydrolase family 2 [Candidatus Hydrogenedentes bacterium]|nr:glycoside hydrolase family 2 [Candidatus Hydrogenedentota bacterium]